ncbi:MAG: GltB/FmdC/FwdC-like GXGXG domain-containing protein, partial [Actinomycetota bacterium]
GVELRLEGTANDGVGKGMAGGRISIAPPPNAEEAPVLLGNAALYGATGGELFAAGGAGERFAVRNSGATAIVEGVGANGCEYMTGGLVVVLGDVGPNFAAGMTGGLAYVLDPDGSLPRFVNPDLVDVADVPAEARHELADLLRRHVRLTGSQGAAGILAAWPLAASTFRRVVPRPPKAAAIVNQNETSAISTGNTRAL